MLWPFGRVEECNAAALQSLTLNRYKTFKQMHLLKKAFQGMRALAKLYCFTLVIR